MATSIPATITDQVEDAQGLEISYRALHPDAILNNVESNHSIRIPFSSIVNKYKDLLSNIIITQDLTPEEQIQYQYQPKRFSEDTYGSTEFWDTILILNNCKSIIDFKPKMVKLYDPDKLKTYLNEIMIIEDDLGNITY